MTGTGPQGAASSRGRAPALVLGCGALARELLELVDRNGLAGAVDVRCLPAPLHNRPNQIGPLLDARMAELAPQYEHVFLAYADCGTGGAVDRVAEAYGVERLPGDHCYAFYSGLDEFAALAAEDPGTFYLTDFLAQSFEALVWKGLGLDRHPRLRDAYFGNYHRLMYLSQRDDPALVELARAAADRLGLPFEQRRTGYGELGVAIARLAGRLAGEGIEVGVEASASFAAGAVMGAEHGVVPGEAAA